MKILQQDEYPIATSPFATNASDDAPVVSAKLSLKFCYKFVEIRSLQLHA
jgi:hypothetical protein